MKISVIIPAYNAEHYIAQAIASVLSEGVDDIVVVDDGSIDGTAQSVAARSWASSTRTTSG